MMIHFGLKTTFRSILKNHGQPDIKFVIFGQARTGSTLLANLLNSNANIYCDYEILQERILFLYQFINARASLCKKQCYGFKLLSYQLLDVQKLSVPENFLSRIYNDGFKILYLHRRNILRQQISNIYAHKTGIFHKRSFDNITAPQKLRIDPEELIMWIQGSENFNRFEQSALNSLDYLPLSYEDDLLDPAAQQITLDRISEYLGIPSSVAKTDFRKVTPSKYSDFIENYPELMDYIKNSKYKIYL